MHGTLADYKDITDKYLNKEISFIEYKELFNKRYKSFTPKESIQITLANKQIIANT